MVTSFLLALLPVRGNIAGVSIPAHSGAGCSRLKLKR